MEPYCFAAFAATASKPLPFLPISFPAFAFLTTALFSFLVRPAEGFFFLSFLDSDRAANAAFTPSSSAFERESQVVLGGFASEILFKRDSLIA